MVRKPEFLNEEKYGRLFENETMEVNGRRYSGVDRMPWFDFEEAYYAENKLDSLLVLWDAVQARICSHWDFRVLTDMSLARKVAEYSSEYADKVEIVAVSSESLASSCRCIADCGKTEWLGVDAYIHGYGSIIKGGFFKRPELFNAIQVNQYGLFDSMSDAHEYARYYKGIESEHGLEPVPDTKELTEFVWVGKVL